MVISEDSWDLRVCLFRFLLLLPKTCREQDYYGDPGCPMLEPISDGLLIILSFWDKPNASVGKDTGHRHVGSEMSPQGALAILSFILITSSSLRCHSSTGIVVVQSLSHIRLCYLVTCSTPGFPVLHISWSVLKLISIEPMMPSNHLFLCHPLLLLPSIFPSIRVFSNESTLCIRWPKYWSFQLPHQSFQ